MSRFRNHDPRRRGVIAVFVCVSLVMLLGFASLSVDLGYVHTVVGEMQHAVDAGALAGVPNALVSDNMAILRAKSTAGANWVAGSGLHPEEVLVRIGYWNSNGNTFTLPTGLEVARPNAARVVGARVEIPLFFAAVLGHPTTNVSRAATAISGGGICAGLWGLEGIFGAGSVYTDSYDSSAGAYGPGNIYLDGDLCSNQNVVLEGAVDIGGDVKHGFAHDLTIFGQGYTIHGATGPHNQSVPVPAIDMAAVIANNDNATIPPTDQRNRDPFGGTTWDLTNVTGQDTLTLNGGTYYLTSAELAGGAQIIVTAPTTFYIDGPADFSGGGLVNATQDPANLTIYSTGTTLTIAGEASFYGSVIAPNATVEFAGGSQIYGMVMARVLRFRGDVQIHVDSNLVSNMLGIRPEAPVLVQ